MNPITFIREGLWLARAGLRSARCLALLNDCEPWDA